MLYETLGIQRIILHEKRYKLLFSFMKYVCTMKEASF